MWERHRSLHWYIRGGWGKSLIGEEKKEWIQVRLEEFERREFEEFGRKSPSFLQTAQKGWGTLKISCEPALQGESEERWHDPSKLGARSQRYGRKNYSERRIRLGLVRMAFRVAGKEAMAAAAAMAMAGRASMGASVGRTW